MYRTFELFKYDQFGSIFITFKSIFIVLIKDKMANKNADAKDLRPEQVKEEHKSCFR